MVVVVMAVATMIVMSVVPIVRVTEPKTHHWRSHDHRRGRNHDRRGGGVNLRRLYVGRGWLNVYRRRRCHNDSRGRRKRNSDIEPDTRLRGGHGSEYQSGE